VQDIKAIIGVLWASPVLAYSFLAALFLTLVSLFGGLIRLDFLALVRPKVVIHVILFVIIGALFNLLGTYVGEAFMPLKDRSNLQLLATVLGNLHRIPLYIVALAYGPTTGLLAVTLFAAFETTVGIHSLSKLVLGLELLILGWLAIYPSPHVTRWAGSFNATLAYLLAWGTGGIALVTATGGEVSAEKIFAFHQPNLIGTTISIMALWLLAPSFYQRFFPDSRIVPLKPKN
jgi:hypothetical protein